MTMRQAHSSHRWDVRDGICKLCECGITAPACSLPCPKSDEPGVLPGTLPKKTPDVRAMSLEGARGLREGD
jgi:hypothetical protein